MAAPGTRALRRLATIEEGRRPGERCCDPATRPLLDDRAAKRLADDFALLAHPVRLQILDVLARNAGRVCVCDLESAVPVKQPTVSHHLRLLREAGVIAGERRGLWVYYELRPGALAELRARTGGLLAALAPG